MSVRRFHSDQPANFEFTDSNIAWAKQEIAKYPPGRQASAVIALLWRAQAQNDGWLCEPAVRYVADMLDMAYIRVYEVATFYTMFQLRPVGRKAHVQVCGTTPCLLRGAEDIIAVCKRKVAMEQGQLSPDGNFSWEEVECLGACVNAPLVQIWGVNYEDLKPEDLERIIDDFANGRVPKPGPRIKRQFAAPASGQTTLTDSKSINKRRADGDGAIATNQDKPEAIDTADSTNTPPTPETAVVPGDSVRASEVADKVKESGATGKSPTPPSMERADAGRVTSDNKAGRRDNLKLIKGVGVKIEKALNEAGVTSFAQIADLSESDLAIICERLGVARLANPGEWISQARLLASGKDTAFANKVRQGKVPTSSDTSGFEG